MRANCHLPNVVRVFIRFPRALKTQRGKQQEASESNRVSATAVVDFATL